MQQLINPTKFSLKFYIAQRSIDQSWDMDVLFFIFVVVDEIRLLEWKVMI